MKFKHFLYRRFPDLKPEEKRFFKNHQESGCNPLLNVCDKYLTIHFSSDLYWSDEHDLKGDYQALSKEAYEEVGGTPLN